MPTPVPAFPPAKLEIEVLNPVTSKTKNKIKNILFLGDGFAAADRKLFDDSIKKILIRFFRKVPYNLKDVYKYFNIFKIFTPSLTSTSGISCSVEIDAMGMTCLDNPDIAGPSVGKLIDKQTALGLIYTPDIVPKTDDPTLISRFIDSIPLDSEYPEIPSCWKQGGNSFGLVIVLINDDKDGGICLGKYSCIPLGHQKGFFGIDKNGVLMLTTNNIGPSLWDHTPATISNIDNIDYNQTTSIILHELAHGHFNLSDEYEYEHVPARANNPNYFKDAPNIVPRVTVLGPDGKIDPALIKWNKQPLFPGSTDTIVSEPAAEYMKTNNRPLYQKTDDILPSCSFLSGTFTNINFPSHPKKNSRWPARIIGLYEGGGYEYCGVYRPAGICKMRRGANYDLDLCYVCKHTIIEKIDSTLLERLAEKCYPSP